MACGARLSRAKPATLAGMLDYELGTVLPFMQGLIPGFHPGADVRVIGLRRGGALVAGVAYEGFNGHNMWIHVAAVPGARWLVREYLRACFAYPFLVCGVRRLSGYVNESNALARRFNEHLGFHEEARLRGAAPDGGDVILMVMWKEECRHVALF
ncbi:GNAT family N-acetyltransferase [Acidovorax sp. SDU_ACID1]|uniref:GNAT family N-acetyltransferase n=1 Tax=Acidovorax sp. SDU_ACID1 TaxID=3136632 RepID=UPI0038732C59